MVQSQKVLLEKKFKKCFHGSSKCSQLGFQWLQFYRRDFWSSTPRSPTCGKVLVISPSPANKYQCYFSHYCRMTLIRLIKVSSVLMLWPRSCKHLCMCTDIIDVEFLLKQGGWICAENCMSRMMRTKPVARYSLHFVLREDFLITAEMFKISCLQMEARVLHKIRSEPIISSN